MSYGLSPITVNTHEDRIRVIRAYPRWLKFALEGNPFHAQWVLETHVAFAVRAACPWMWFDRSTSTKEQA